MPELVDKAQIRASTNSQDAGEVDCHDTQQGGEHISIAKATLQKLSARERLDRLSKLRTAPDSISFAISGARKGGGKGEVVQATFRRRMWSRKEKVAVKKLRFHRDLNLHMFANSFVHEVETMAELSHENIVRLLAFVEDFENGTAWIVLSWEPNGNVSEFLASGKREVPERISLIQDTFEGLRYLHTRQPPICHGDLKSLNILVSASHRAVITDFGSARVVRESVDGITSEGSDPGKNRDPTPEGDCHQINIVATGNQLTLTGPAWSLRWAPPEVVNGSHPGLPSDIWSAGWVCWEIMTDKLPFSELDSGTAITLRVIEGKVPSAGEDEHLSQIVTLCSLMTDCWAFTPGERPTISRCCDEVKWMPSIAPLGGEPLDPKVVGNRLLLQMGRTHYLHARYAHADSLFKRVLEIATRRKDRKEKSEALYWLGTLSAAQGRHPAAEEFYTRAHAAYALIGDELGRANTLRGLGDIYRLQSKVNVAEEAFARAQEIYNALGDHQGQASTLCGLGHIYRVLTDYERAKERFRQSQEIYALIGDAQGRANTLQGLGSVYSLESELTQATEALDEALSIYARIGDDGGHAQALLGLGGLHYERCRYTVAESTYTQALEINSRIGNQWGQANALYGLGKVHLSQSRYTEAATIFKSANSIYARMSNAEGQANTLHGLGEAFRCLSEYDQASSAHTEAQQIYSRIGHDERAADALYQMGKVYRQQSKYDQATSSYFKARAIYTRIGYQKGRAAALCGLGDVHRDQSQYDQATRFYTEAKEIYTVIGDYNGERRVLGLLQLGTEQGDCVDSPQSEHGDLGPRTSCLKPYYDGSETPYADVLGAAQQQQVDFGARSLWGQGSTSSGPPPDHPKLFGLSNTDGQVNMSGGDTEAINPQVADDIRTDSGFRGALGYGDPEEQRKSSWRSSSTGARRSSTNSGGPWRRWVELLPDLAPPEDREHPQQEDRGKSLQSEHAQLGPRTSSPEPHHDESQTASGEGSGAAQQQHQDFGAGSPVRQGSTNLWPLPDPLKFLGLTRTQSMPHIGNRKTSRQNTQDSHVDNAEIHTNATQRWNALRQRVRQPPTAGGLSPLKGKHRSSIVQHSMAAQVELSEELMAGPLAGLILKMWFQRDENGRRRVPVLLQHLKIRVSDSVHPQHGTHAVFRIECEYGDRAARWVIYRELKDFLSLHAHYAFSYTAYRARVGGNELDIPEFPLAGIPLFNILKKQARKKGNAPRRAEFAREQREVLETYLIRLIKAVIFRPEANRLCRWFEISALSVALASRGGIQGKAGLLRVISNASRKGPHVINFSAWKQNHPQTWWLVRESYLVSVPDPAELDVDDVFMLDADFSIERPKRVYRQGLSQLHIGGSGGKEAVDDKESRRHEWDLSKRQEKGKEKEKDGETEKGETETITLRSTIGKLFSTSSKSSESKGQPNGDVHLAKEEGEKGNDRAKSHRDSASLKEKSKADMNHLAVPNQGGKECEASGPSNEGPPKGQDDRPQPPEERPTGIVGNVTQADVKPVKTPPNAKGQYRTANLQGTDVDDVPDPHTHGSRWFKTLRRSSSVSSRSSSSSSNWNDKNNQTVIDPSIGQDPRKVGTKEEDEVAGIGSENTKKRQATDVSQHTFYISNGRRKLNFIAKNERQMLQFIASMERMAAQSRWTGKNRFGSFAPIRLNVSAQWLADGRDYFCNLSRAIMLAKELIYIHDWWLSPELYLRRPGQEHYRLDRLLQRKAEQGVKIYIILYKEVSIRTTPIESDYAKRKLMALHPNIMVQRSPAHLSTETFFWAHHEKMCVIDERIAFMGGLDLRFGRWDTPEHILMDDRTTEGPDKSIPAWLGKDYNNARAMEFRPLNKPYGDIYSQSKVARMPWHDVGIQIVGQPARDLCRHFVDRWNYLLRKKTPSRIMPLLLPAPDFQVTELNDQGLTGTCEVQICRSAGPWSLGTTSRIEHSIQNAYLKAIELSEHFVYMENQFFITSTVVNDIPIENNIGDALVDRIIRAHKKKTKWRACILLPLLLGHTLPIDHNDASSIRLMVELQNRSISRGPHSIFSRLRKEGIDPNDYISFFSLRGWGKLEDNTLITEKVYLHAKLMIVDDRVAIIGSANINERSMRGDRDSELAVVVRDTDMIPGKMAGKSFKVGRFAHTLRIRLMREHVGIDTDAICEEDIMTTQAKEKRKEVKTWDPDHEQVHGTARGIPIVKHRGPMEQYEVLVRDGSGQDLLGVNEATAKFFDKQTNQGLTPTAAPTSEHKDEQKRICGSDGSQQPGFASSKVPTLADRVAAEHLPKKEEGQDKPLMDAIDEGQDETGSDAVSEARVQDRGDIFGAPADAAPSAKEDNKPRKHLTLKIGANPHTLPTPKPEIGPHGFGDPLDPRFWKDTWCATAIRNTEIYRKVFHCTPDDLVTTWKMYREYLTLQERLNKPPKDAHPTAPHVGQVPAEGGTAGEEMIAPSRAHLEGEMDPKGSILSNKKEANPAQRSRSPTNDGESSSYLNPPPSASSQRRSAEHEIGSDGRPRGPTDFDEPLEQGERDKFEALVEGVKGHLVVLPTRFLEEEDFANNFLFSSDKLLPMPIFN